MVGSSTQDAVIKSTIQLQEDKQLKNSNQTLYKLKHTTDKLSDKKNPVLGDHIMTKKTKE